MMLVPLISGATASWAQDALARAKDDMVPQNASNFDTGVGPMQLVQLLLALAVVIVALKFVLPRLAPRLQRRITHRPSASMQVAETIEMGSASLHLVRVRDRELLIGAVPTGLQLLADVTPSRATPASPPTFLDFVDSAMANPDSDQGCMVREAYDRLGSLLK